jgi:hypothetical protein
MAREELKSEETSADAIAHRREHRSLKASSVSAAISAIESVAAITAASTARTLPLSPGTGGSKLRRSSGAVAVTGGVANIAAATEAHSMPFQPSSQVASRLPNLGSAGVPMGGFKPACRAAKLLEVTRCRQLRDSPVVEALVVEGSWFPAKAV